MTALLFDTLRLSRTLRDKGHFTSEQAEALAEALGEASQGDLATKADLAELRTEIAELKTELKTEIAELRTELKAEIAELRTELKAEIAGLRTELRAEIAAVRTELLKWIIGAIGFQTVVILGALISIIKTFAR
jgi:F0F1-type ATP synthase membrane subunit b/b'